MIKFKEDGIGVDDLIKLIPEELLAELAFETKVEFQAKKLFGQVIFTLLKFRT